MKLQNGYKLVYERAADGKRTFYASKTGYPTENDLELASFVDTDFIGKIVYEHKGKFYVPTGKVPAYDDNGVPTDALLFSDEKFNEVFAAATDSSVEQDAEGTDEPTGDATNTEGGQVENTQEPDEVPEEEPSGDADPEPENTQGETEQ